MGGHFQTGTFRNLEDSLRALKEANHFYEKTYGLYFEKAIIEYKPVENVFSLRVYFTK